MQSRRRAFGKSVLRGQHLRRSGSTNLLLIANSHVQQIDVKAIEVKTRKQQFDIVKTPVL